MTDHPGLHPRQITPQAARALIGSNIKRLRRLFRVTQEELADAIDTDVPTLSALELGQGFLPVKAFPLIASALGITFQELIIELGREESLAVCINHAVSEMATLTPDRVETIRLRDAVEEERRTAERQFEFLVKRRGIDDIFTREAASRMERLTSALRPDPSGKELGGK